MISMSREPSTEHKIQFPSVVELKDGLIEAANRIARRVKFRGRKLKSGPLMNGVVLYYLLLPEEEQVAIAKEGLRRYEALLGLNEPLDDLESIAADRGKDSGERVVGFPGRVGGSGPKPKGKDKPPKMD